MKKCPYCAELIQDEAVLCRYCFKELPAPGATPATAQSELDKKIETAQKEVATAWKLALIGLVLAPMGVGVLIIIGAGFDIYTKNKLIQKLQAEKEGTLIPE